MGAMTHHEHLAQADRYIAECKNRIARQREIIATAYENAHPTVIPVSLLRALEENLRSFEKHRQLIFDQQKKRTGNEREQIVLLIIYSVAFVMVGDLADYLIGLIVEREFGGHASLIVFLALYALVLWVAWLLAVRTTAPRHAPEMRR